MKALVSRLMRLRVWRPAALLMQQLRFGGKMTLISAAFALPLAWLLFALVQARMSDLHVVRLERDGLRYAQQILPAIEATGTWRTQARNAAYGDPKADVQQTAAAFDKKFAVLVAQDAQLAGALGTADAMAEVNKALQAAQQAQASHASPQQVLDTMNQLSRGLGDVLDRVVDTSGLALDPEIASYYLISLSLMRTPDTIQHVSELRGIGRSAFTAGSITPEQLAGAFEHLGMLHLQITGAADDVRKVRAAAPDKAGLLVTRGDEAMARFEAVARQTFVPGQTQLQGQAADYARAANDAMAAEFAQIQDNTAVLDALLSDREQAAERGLWLSVGLATLGMVIATYLFAGFYQAMSQGISQLRKNLIRVSMGDLRTDRTALGKDELAGLQKELQNMCVALGETVQRVQQASGTVVMSSETVAHGMTDLSSRTEAAAAALEESSAALEQSSATIQTTAESVRKASEIAAENALTASKGGEVMSSVERTMIGIQESSKRISDIIGVIDGIAFQTNILALNAAVEAARAGEQGRGFAVVAGEVRSLAGRSSEAAKEIRSLISRSSEEVSKGSEVVHTAGQTMTDIVKRAEQIRQLLDEVATGAREQSLGIQQVGQAVHDLDQNTQANAALVAETSAEASTQRSTAVGMAVLVDEFRLPGVRPAVLTEGINVDEIIDAHREWKIKLRQAIDDGTRVDVATLVRDDCCALGRWIHGDGQRLSARRTFTELVERHTHFHRVAGSVGQLINDQRIEEAEDALAPGTPFAAATADVVTVLANAKRGGFA